MAHAFTHDHFILYSIAAIGALLTSFYMFRLTYLTFYGESRMEPHTEAHVHESPSVMIGPLVALGFLSLVGGLLLGFPPEHGWLHQFLAPVVGSAGEHEVSMGLLSALMVLATGIAVIGWGLAHFMYQASTPTADVWAEKFSGAYRTLLNKYYVDEIYDFMIVEPLKRLGELLDWFDRTVVDGLVRGVGQLADWGSAGSTWIEKYIVYAGLNVIGYGNHLAAREGRKMQSGMVHHYVALIVAGLFLLALVVQSEAAGVNSAAGSFGLSFGLAFAGAIMLAAMTFSFNSMAQSSLVLNPEQQQQVSVALEEDAQIMSDALLVEQLAGQPAEVQAEILRINTEARNNALQVALMVSFLAGLLGFLNSFRMVKLPDPEPSNAVESLLAG